MRQNDGGYRVQYEEQPFYRELPLIPEVIHPLDGSIACFARVYAPTRLSTTIYHRWEYQDASGDWQERFRLGYDIAGVNENGYGGYTQVTSFSDGLWRCSVETERGQVLAQLRAQVQASGFAAYFRLIGGENYVPHRVILQLMRHCLAGLALYRLLPHIRRCRPTKMYEHMALGRPLIFTAQPEWEAWNAETPFGFAYSPANDPEQLWQKLQQWQAPHLPKAAWAWETEIETLHPWLVQRLQGVSNN